MATKIMLQFMQKNRTNMVIFGEHRTPENRPVISRQDMERADRTFYRLDDGTEFTLTDRDKHSAPSFTPDWGFGATNN